MENADSPAKEAALDNKSAYAGNLSPDPEIDIDQLGEDTGLSVRPGKSLSVANDFDRRDQNRYELDVDSKEESSELYDWELTGELDDDVDIIKTETGQIEGIHTQSAEVDALDI